MAAQMAASSPEMAAEPAEPDEDEEEEEPAEEEDEDEEESEEVFASSAFFSLVPLDTMRVVGSVRVVDRTAETVTLPSMVSW